MNGFYNIKQVQPMCIKQNIINFMKYMLKSLNLGINSFLLMIAIVIIAIGSRLQALQVSINTNLKDLTDHLFDFIIRQESSIYD